MLDHSFIYKGQLCSRSVLESQTVRLEPALPLPYIRRFQVILWCNPENETVQLNLPHSDTYKHGTKMYIHAWLDSSIQKANKRIINNVTINYLSHISTKSWAQSWSNMETQGIKKTTKLTSRGVTIQTNHIPSLLVCTAFWWAPQALTWTHTWTHSCSPDRILKPEIGLVGIKSFRKCS